MGKTAITKQEYIHDYFAGSIMAKLSAMESLGPSLEKAASLIVRSMMGGGKWILFGNGGSAADAQHIAAEMVGRLYQLERRGLPALALTTDSSALTCVGNDYGYDRVFERQVEALARRGDVVLGISTSGKSPNVLKAIRLAKKMGCRTLAFTGGDGGKLAEEAELCMNVGVAQPFHVQETHITMGHLLCFLVERELLERRFIKKRA